jgi:hypothetical protein
MNMWHRPLAEMLTDLFDGFTAARTDYALLRARSVEMTLPIEVRLQEVAGEMTFIADLPVWRWRTDFDQPPSRMRITLEESEL